MGAPANPSTDIYALGATYFCLLTGRPPYVGKDIVSVQDAHLRLAVPDPRDLAESIPPACALLARRMLSKKPKDRFGSADDVAREAHRILDALDGPVRTARERRRRGPPPSIPGETPTGRASPTAEPRPLSRPPPAPESSELFGPLPAARAGEPLASAMGFFRRPFTPVETAQCPYQGEPFAALVDGLVEALDAGPGAVVAVTGAGGSGRSTLCRRAAARLCQARPVFGFDLSASADPAVLLSRLGRVAGDFAEREPTGLDAIAEARLASLARARQGPRAPAVVLNGLGASPGFEGDLARLLGGAWSKAFATALVCPPGLIQRLVKAGLSHRGVRLVELAVPALDARQVEDYVHSWIQASRPPGAPGILFSPDARLLLAHRTAGHLETVNCLAENMLVLAAAHGRRLLTSWDAWVAPADGRWWGSATPADLPSRPMHWPSREASALIDACRTAAGLPRFARAFDSQPDRPGRPFSD